MTREIAVAPLTAESFAPFGEVIEAAGAPDRIINQGLCGRFHDRATLDIVDGRPGISLFRSEPRALPYRLEMVERHPLGSQAFLPMTGDPFLVVAAADEGGVPGPPRAFLTSPGQGALFAVIDRIGPGDNLEEHWFGTPWTVTRAG
jgi:ureidoglycolate lyase